MGTRDAPTAVAAELRRLKPLQWSKTEAQRVLELWRASGRPLETFAHEHGLVPQRVRRWRDLLAEREDAQVSLVPAVIVGGPLRPRVAPRARPAVVVQATHDCAVEVVEPDRVAPAWVAALIVALEATP